MGIRRAARDNCPTYNRQMLRSWDVAGDLPPIDLRPLISAERAEMLTFLRSLDESGWTAPTANIGWNVHDVALHVLGSQIGRLSPTRGGAAREGRMAFDDLAELIEHSNEDWVRATRRIAPFVTVELLAFIGPKVDDAFAALDLDAPGTSVGWTGDGPTRAGSISPANTPNTGSTTLRCASLWAPFRR